eukprot:TRINITY_DN3825_c0_g1_i2.p1 TRINITY_DN3825_c0_g1~~TRINITY_DN3825_c0_g1_i2.p1  ORF type:complete len:494 (+),score=18.11 TRINITY_DN3825_c0_g1_i2:438-1919(+)
MEYYAPAQGGPSSYAGLEGSVGDPGAGPSLVHEPWPLKHGSPSPAGPNADAALDDVWQMTNPDGMETSSGLYPERPGEQDCPFYMRTGLCGFGMSCRFNHPPNRKLAQAVARGKGEYPERVGQPECQYYLKTGNCKFGATCKYHHPRDKAGSTGRVQVNVLGYPLRPNEKECAYYMRTSQCKYGATCKFHHPPPTMMSPSTIYPGGPSASAPAHYQGGLPTWPGIARAPYPRLQSSYTPVLLPPQQTIVSVPSWSTYQGPVGPLQSPDGQHAISTSYVYGPAPQADQIGVHGAFSPYLQGSAAMGLPALQPQPLGLPKETSFPERPGQPECQFYMKTGDCKFGISCRYHHPKDRATPSPTCTLSPMGLPLRPGAQPCTFYTKYGFCKFGHTCKFDHPLGPLSYSPSASSLADVAVAPYPIGSSPTTLAPSSSSIDTHVQESSALARSSSKDPVPEAQSSQTRESSTEAVISSSSQPGQAQTASTSQTDTLNAS